MSTPVVTPKHPSLEAVKQLPRGNIHRAAYEVAAIIDGIGADPQHGLADPMAVGSFTFFPESARDLDFEVRGVSWDYLQDALSQRRGLFTSFRLTKGLDNGTIPQDREEEGYGGNAYVAVWASVGEGPNQRRPVNISIPLTVDENTNRYDRSTVKYDPDLDFKTAAQRRSFAHTAACFSPLRRQIVDPFDGAAAVASKTLVIIDPKSYQRDPLSIYNAVIEMSKLGFKPDSASRKVLEEMASGFSGNTTSVNLYNPRLNYERGRLLTAAKPSIALGNALDLSLLENQIPVLFEIIKTHGAQKIFEQVDDAWLRAGKEGWNDGDKLVFVLGAIASIANQSSRTEALSALFNSGQTTEQKADFETQLANCAASF